MSTDSAATTAIKNIAEHLVYSPATIFSKSADLVNESLNGSIDVVDATNPFIELLEVNAITTAGLMSRTDLQTRKRFPKLAQTLADLYPHMTDEDYVDIFATPVRNHIISLGLGLDEIKTNAVYNSTSQTYEIQIPRDTLFLADGLHFTFHQPIIISVYQNGDVQAIFDSSVTSPIMVRLGNTISTHTETYEGVKMFVMDIPMDQLNIESYSETISASSPWSKDIVYSNDFYYARGYYSSDNGTSWTEMHVTYDGNSYDPINPTMTITVNDGTIHAIIPDVYIKNNKVGSEARIDVYTTQGYQSINLSNVAASEYQVAWNDFSNLSSGYISPLTNINNMVVYSTGTTTGGASALSFDDVRNRVIYSGYGKDGAYTLTELKQKLTNMGYTGYLQQDDLTERVYVAARRLDTDAMVSAAGLYTGAGTINNPVTFIPDRNQYTYGMVVENDRATISPKMLYKEVAGGISIVTDTEWNQFDALADDVLVSELNDNSYFWTMFHTILDYSNNTYDARAYWMTSPTLSYMNLISANSGLGFSSSVSSVTIDYTDSGYSVTVTCSRPKDTTGFKAQLWFASTNGTRYYWEVESSNMQDDTMDFVFTIGTQFSIDSDDAMDCDAVDTSGDSYGRLGINPNFDFFILTQSDSTYASSFDNLYAVTDPGTTYSGLTYETLNIRLGYLMDGLNLIPRSVIANTIYETYGDDVYKTYDADVYEVDTDGTPTFTISGDVLTLNLLHNAGDQVLDTNGDPEILHHKGEVKYDSATNEPIVSQDSVYGREIRLPLIDAKFRYATVDEVETYVSGIPALIYQYLTDDISVLQENLLENTKLFYEPLVTHKSAQVKISSSKTVTMTTALSFVINYHITDAAYYDNDFRTTLTDSTKSTLVTQLSNATISTTDIIIALQELAPNKILNVTFSNTPLGSTGVAEIIGGSSSFTLAKIIELEANGLLKVTEDVTVSFTH